MNILLTNDDGYNSAGLQQLYEKLKCHHQVYICAPLIEKSSTGHAVSLFKPLKFIEIDGGFAVNGTPADCVKIALHGFFKDKTFDLVVSGINKGINMGHDIFYSGTVAGAREGVMNNISGIACSKNVQNSSSDFSLCADNMVSFIESMEKLIIKEKILLNINFPATKKFKGTRVTHLGNRIYDNTISFERKNNQNYVTLMGNDLTFQKDEGSDLDCVNNGFVSITPLLRTKESFSTLLKKKISSCIKKA